MRQRRNLYAQGNVLSRSFHMCSINVKNTLFRTFCTPMYTCHLWWNYKAQSFHKLKVAFNNAFRMMHNLPTYCSASEMFTVNSVADFKAVIRNLVHRFMTRLTISKHLLVRSILSSDLYGQPALCDIGQDYCRYTITVDDNYVYKPVL